MYSGIYSTNTGRVLHPEVVEIYQKELLNLRNLSTYMGIWQFHQCADVLQRPICSVCPEQTNPTVRRDMNRVILPLNESHINRAPVFIMWTPLHIYARAYDVKHFVPLITKPVYRIFCTVSILFVIFVTIFVIFVLKTVDCPVPIMFSFNS